MFESALLNKSKKNGGKCKLETWMENATEEDLKIGNNTQIDKIVIKKDLEKLQRFFTYFTDFNKNRKNVYSKEKLQYQSLIGSFMIIFQYSKEILKIIRRLKKITPN